MILGLSSSCHAFVFCDLVFIGLCTLHAPMALSLRTVLACPFWTRRRSTGMRPNLIAMKNKHSQSQNLHQACRTLARCSNWRNLCASLEYFNRCICACLNVSDFQGTTGPTGNTGPNGAPVSSGAACCLSQLPVQLPCTLHK